MTTSAPSTASAASERDALQGALRDGDGPACAAALQRVRVDEPSLATRYEPYCQMLLGHCTAALAVLAAAVGEIPARELAYEYCPPDGDLEDHRIRRATKQERWHRDPAGCRLRATWSRYATSAEDDILVAGNAMQCWGAIGRCDEARAVAADLVARLAKRGTTSDRADVARWVPSCATH